MRVSNFGAVLFQVSKMASEKIALKRELGLLSGICLVVGVMIGSGIFISPGGVLQNSGSVAVSVIVWLVCGIMSLLGESSSVLNSSKSSVF